MPHCGAGDLGGSLLTAKEGFRARCVGALYPAAEHYEPLGVVDWRGHPALAFAVEHRDGNWTRTATVTYVGGIAYPVHVVVHDVDGAAARRTESELAAFTQGPRPRMPGPLPPPTAAAPVLDWVPAGRVFVLEDAAEPFPLWKALEVGREDQGFAAFLDANPGHMVTQARQSRQDIHGLQFRGWELVVAGGRDAQSLTVARGLPADAWSLPEAARDALAVDLVHAKADDRPPEALAVQEGPTVSSLLAASTWMWPDQEGCYGYSAGVREGLQGEDETRVTWWAGPCASELRAAPTAGTPGVEFESRYRGGSLVWDRDGLAWVSTSDSSYLDTTRVAPGKAARDEEAEALATLHVPASSGGFGVGRAAGYGALSILAAALYVAWPGVKSGAIALFSRVSGPSLLAHPARRRLLEAIERRPGLHLQELGRAAGVRGGSLVHHVRALERGGHVQVRHANGYRLHFARAHQASDAAGVAAAEGARRILAVLRSRPGRTGQELAAEVGLAASTVSYHLRRLAAAGLAEPERDGHAWRWRAGRLP